MTQVPDQKSVLLDIVSIYIPETAPAQLPELSGTFSQPEPDRAPVKLIPGENSSLVIDLENLDTRPLHLTCELTGNFPHHWCQTQIPVVSTLGELPGQPVIPYAPELFVTLLPGERRSVVLCFQVHRDFFEAEEAVFRDTEALQLNYSGRFNVYGSYLNNQSDNRPLLEFVEFDLFLRPRSPYIKLLPQIYQEIDFVGRFLKIIETTLEPDLQIFGNLWAYLDPLTAPENMLPFLAHWVGWQNIPTLSLQQQRRLIRNALEIYRASGTRRGLRFYLHLVTGLPLDEDLPEVSKHISIIENFTQGAVMGSSYLGIDTILGGGKPFHFQVRLLCDPDTIDEKLVRTVIEAQTPAFCTYDLKIDSDNHI